MSEHVNRRDSLNCDVIKDSRDTLLKVRCELECAIKKLEMAEMMEKCKVQLDSSCCISSITDLGNTNKKLLQDLEDKLLNHARKHPAHVGRRDADSGYCNSIDFPTHTVTEETQDAIAERQDYPTIPENLAPLSIHPQQTAPEDGGCASHC
ncbi:hypothetical protein Btru_035546 [Bulinus truncatus]|nr:hypothetical protein Btru_035546 [Bulinus truncatus]